MRDFIFLNETKCYCLLYTSDAADDLWWGEIIWEYYGASEGNGLTVIDSKEWLRHRGSVGKAKIGKVHICGDDGEELPRGETGLIYFSDSPKFEYHNDPQKTKGSRNQYGWSTLGLSLIHI